MITWTKGTTVFRSKRLACGTAVFDCHDERHVGFVESVRGAFDGTDAYWVRFESGLLAEVPEQRIRVCINDEEEKAR